MGFVGTNSDDLHFLCDVTPDGDVFMACKTYVSNRPVPCAEGLFFKTDDQETGIEFGSEFESLDNTYGAELMESWA